MAYEIKRGDLEPPLDATLKQADGSAIDLTTAGSVKALIRHAHSGVVAVNRAITIVDAAAGKVRVTWATGETDVAGPYELEAEITWFSGRPQTVPSGPYYRFSIYEDLG